MFERGYQQQKKSMKSGTPCLLLLHAGSTTPHSKTFLSYPLDKSEDVMLVLHVMGSAGYGIRFAADALVLGECLRLMRVVHSKNRTDSLVCHVNS